MKQKQWLSFAALGLVWGSTWIPSQVISEQIPPLFAEAARFLLAAIFLLPIILWQRLPLPETRALTILLLLSVTMIAGPFVLLLGARQNLPSATVAVLFAATPLLVVLLAPLLDDHPIPNSVMPAAIVGLASIGFTVSAVFSASQALAAATLLLAVASISASSLIARRELRSVSPLVTTALLLAVSALLLFVASRSLEQDQSVHWTREAVASLFFLAAVGGAFAYATWFWLLQQWPAYRVATLQWVQPLVALCEAALLVHMRLSPNMLYGSLVTLVCVTMVSRAQTQDDDTVSLRRN